MLKISEYAEQIEKKQAGIEFVLRKLANDVRDRARQIAVDEREKDFPDLRSVRDEIGNMKFE